MRDLVKRRGGAASGRVERRATLGHDASHRMAIVLSEALVEFIESGVSIVVGSRDANNRPECSRGLGAKVGDDRHTLTIYLNFALSERMRADFADNGRIAIGFSRIIDHRSVQLKGRVSALRPATPPDHEIQDRYLAAFAEQVSYAGMPRSVVRNVRLRPAVAVEVEVEELFHQTPGPGAGRRIESFA
jgi:hypothetical protein